jgi:hypothetical protein
LRLRRRLVEPEEHDLLQLAQERYVRVGRGHAVRDGAEEGL